MPRKSKKQTGMIDPSTNNQGRSEWMKTYNKNIRMQKDKQKDVTEDDMKKPTEEKSPTQGEETMGKLTTINFKSRKSNRKANPYRSPAVTIENVQIPRVDQIIGLVINKSQE